MKTFNGYVLLKQEELDKLTKPKDNTAQLDSAKAEVKKLTKTNKDLKEKLDEAGTKIDVLSNRVDDSRVLLEKEIELTDKEGVLDALKSALDRREERIEKKAKEVEEDETNKYQEGYADGVADGLRKAHDITAKDRENAMKVAMVAAASHSTPGIVKEATDALQLSEGNKKG